VAASYGLSPALPKKGKGLTPLCGAAAVGLGGEDDVERVDEAAHQNLTNRGGHLVARLLARHLCRPYGGRRGLGYSSGMWMDGGSDTEPNDDFRTSLASVDKEFHPGC
jgi:hypothetical protein